MGQNASREAFAIDLPSGIRADREAEILRPVAQ